MKKYPIQASMQVTLCCNHCNRRLATANRSRVKICGTKIYGQVKGRGRPCENGPVIEFDQQAKFGYLYSGVRVCKWSQKFWGRWGPAFLEWRASLTTRNTSLPTCEFDRSSQTICA